MLVTATEARRIAEEVLKGVKAVNVEETVPVKGEFIEENDEIKFVSKMITYQYSQGKIIYEFDFEISEKTSEILQTMLYYVRRNIVAW